MALAQRVDETVQPPTEPQRRLRLLPAPKPRGIDSGNYTYWIANTEGALVAELSLDSEEDAFPLFI